MKLFRTLLAVQLCSLCLVGYGAGLNVSVLRCEHQTDPLGVDMASPVFSWVLSSNERNTQQTSYRILVSESEKLLKRDIGDVWDSGIRQSDNSVYVPYEGHALQSGHKYYWKVMACDNHGETSGWSSNASFLMGLMEKADWSGAEWIALDTIPSIYNVIPGYQTAGATVTPLDREPRMPQFRKEFTAKRNKIEKATAYVCGLGQFEMTINGNRVGDHFLDPAWTKYDKSSQYVTFDVTSYLRKGKNALGVRLGNGFLHVPRDESRYIKLITTYSAPKLICKVQIDYQDGSQDIIVTDQSWKVTSSAVTFSSVYGGEDYDARLELDGWDQPGYNDADWSQPIVVPAVGRLKSQFQKPVKVKAEHKCIKYWESQPGIYIYDFGQNASAIPSLRVKGQAGNTVIMRPAEYLTDEGLSNQNNSGTPYYFSYTLKGDKEESWTPAFSYYGFRYIQVEGAVPQGADNPEGLPEIQELSLLHTSSDSEAVGQFSCSNDLFNQISTLIDWSIKSNLSHVMTDCPHREKLGWLEQTHLMGPSLAFCYDISLLFRKALFDMTDCQTDEGLIPDTAPEYAQFPHDFRDSPEWGSAGVILPWFLYEWYGDQRVLSDNYMLMKNYVEYLTSRTNDHLLYHGLGDWYDLGPKHPGYSQLTTRGLTPTAIYYRDLQILAMTAAILGKEQDREKYERLAEEVKIAFNAKFFNAEKGYYDHGSQTANAISLCLGLASDADRSSCVSQIVKDIRDRDNCITAGDIGFSYLLRILEAEGQSEVIYDMTSQSEKPGYGYQLKQGATALTESWAALKTASHNHCMLGHVMEWFYVGLGGIRKDPTTPGFKHFELRPDIVGDITHTNVDFVSPYGEIQSHWKLIDEQLVYDVTVPVGASATVRLPLTDLKKVKEGGVPVDSISTLLSCSVDNEYCNINVGSGKYRFTIPYKSNK